jgi:hypothetical protein
MPVADGTSETARDERAVNYQRLGRSKAFAETAWVRRPLYLEEACRESVILEVA